MLPLEFLIVIALAVGATFFVIVVSTGLIINKGVEMRQARSRERLYGFYSGMLAELLLQPLPELGEGFKLGRTFEHYENLIEPVKNGLSWSTPARKQLHRMTIRRVLIDFARDLAGESLDRLHYFFYSFGFVEEEIELLRSTKWWVRAQAARDLGLIRARKGTIALTAALEDPHDDVRNQAVQSLVVIVGVEALRTIFKIVKNMSQWTTLELSVIVREFEDQSLPYLIEALQYQDQSVVLFSIEMLAEIGFVAAVGPLLEIAESYPNVAIRAKAVESLGRLGDERSEPLLRALLTNPYPALRTSSVRALERIGSPASIPQLRERLSRGTLEDRISAGRALARSGAGGVEVLRGLTDSDDVTLKGISLQVLEESEGVA